MATQMHELTAAEIQARLSALEEKEAAHAGRDMDGELAEALTQGGDVDALEQQHLEAERLARRYRVERSALESALPQALAREGQTAVDNLRSQHDELRPEAIKARDSALRAAATLEKSLAKWIEIQTHTTRLGNQARATGRAAGIEKPERFGTFTSGQLNSLPERLIGPLYELSNRQAQITGPSEAID